MKLRDTAAARDRFAPRLIMVAALAGILTGCALGGSSSAVASTPVSASLHRHDNAFSYCRVVGTIDRPDARYTGSNPPPDVIAGLIRALRAEPSDPGTQTFIRGTYWRCMDGEVYACNVGANLPCDSHADTQRTPTEGENEYCASNPDVDFIPMYVTGHATIYDWRCEGTTAVAGKPIAKVDSRGFIAGIWYRIPAPCSESCR